MSGGLLALSSFQRGIETTSGTAVAATGVQPILDGWLVERVEREFPDETRNSFINAYRNFALKNYVEVSGVRIAPTFTTLAYMGSMFWKGLASGAPRKPAGSLSAVTVYTYTHTPTATSDDLNTMTGELGDDVQNFQVPYMLGNRIELAWGATSPLVCTMDFLGQRAVAAARTAALTSPEDEDIIGPLATVTIDTSTIGSTAVTTAVELKVAWDNQWSQEFVLDGNLYPRGAHRGGKKIVTCEATLLFSSATEYTSIFQNSGIGTPRKIRISTDGSVIAGSTGSVKRNLQADVYCVWQTAEFDTIGGQRAVKFAGMAQYDSSATWDQQVVIKNALSTIP